MNDYYNDVTVHLSPTPDQLPELQQETGQKSFRSSTYLKQRHQCEDATNMISRTIRIIKRLGMIMALSVCTNVYADRLIEPTDVEWNAWPEYCKAAYLNGSYSEGSRFRGRMPAGQVDQILANYMQTVGIQGGQHFCIGMVFVDRARRAGVKTPEAKNNLASAIDEFKYSYPNTKEDAPRYSLYASYYGTALFLSGKRQQAFEMWDKGIRLQPASRESYLAMAKALLDEKKPKEALDVLLRYDHTKEYESPDAEYFLGFTYFQLGMHDEAKEHADKAYRLGYPSLWLQNQLKNVGK